MSALISELRHRRVFQFLGLYLGGSWAVIQFVDFIVERYLLSSHLTDAALITLVSLTPAVILLAYYFGAPGRQEIGRLGKIGVPLNLLVTATLVFVFLGSRDLSAAAQEVTVTDEEGREVTRLVPTESALRKVTVFFFDNETGDDGLDWLSPGLAALLTQDLKQNPFLNITSISGFGSGIFDRLVRAGYENGVGVPLTLKTRLAKVWNLDFFIAGELSSAGEQGFEARVTAYEAGSGRVVAEHRAAAATPGELVDDISRLLIEDLDLPGSESGLVADLPAAEIFTEDLEAMRAFVEGAMAELKSNDLELAARRIGRAVEIDPTFALAQSRLAQVLFKIGDTEGASRAIDTALQHDYRLLEGDRFVVKGTKYLIDNQIEKQVALYEMWVELEPGDLNALAQLANTYLWFGNRVGEAKALYYRILDVHPSETWTLHRIADLALVEGNPPEAIEALERYFELHPENHSPLIRIGRIHRASGDLAAAEKSFERAALMASGFVQPSIDLANLALRRGDLERAGELLAEAEGIANDAGQRHLVQQARIGHLRFRGEFAVAFAGLEELDHLAQQVHQPIDRVLGTHVQNIDLYAAAGRLDDLELLLAEWTERLGEPFGSFLRAGSMYLALERGDAEASRRHRQVFEGALEEWQREDMRFITELGRARELELEGAPGQAVEALESALEYFRTSVQSTGDDDSMRVELLRRLGEMHRLAGDPQRAIERLDEALVLVPALPNAHLEMARVHLDQGDRARAREHLDRALEVWRFADASCPAAAEARDLDARL